MWTSHSGFAFWTHSHRQGPPDRPPCLPDPAQTQETSSITDFAGFDSPTACHGHFLSKAGLEVFTPVSKAETDHMSKANTYHTILSGG